MKNIVRIAAVVAAACLAPGVSAGEARVFPRLPEGTLPDTEVATNVALNVQCDGNMRFSISIDAASCTSNADASLSASGDGHPGCRGRRQWRLTGTA